MNFLYTVKRIRSPHAHVCMTFLSIGISKITPVHDILHDLSCHSCLLMLFMSCTSQLHKHLLHSDIHQIPRVFRDFQEISTQLMASFKSISSECKCTAKGKQKKRERKREGLQTLCSSHRIMGKDSCRRH